ncbi:MAG: hypothetical protein ACXITV_01540 [Luteibaculaceae bacterium]
MTLNTILKAAFGLAFILSLSACSLFKSTGYETLVNQQDIEINHRWVHPSKEGNPSSLFLEVRNRGTEDKEVSFRVLFYQNGLLKEESDTARVCLRPGTKRSGKTNGLVLQPYSMSTEEIKSETFSIDLVDVVVEQKSCR